VIGDTVFPNPHLGIGFYGLTKRELLAAFAMMGHRAAPVSSGLASDARGIQLWLAKNMAAQSVLDADALIAELAKVKS
jgi:hypothetical protein